MTRLQIFLLSVLSTTLLVAPGCKKDDVKKEAPAARTSDTEPAAAPAKAAPAEPGGHFAAKMMLSYEDCRALLAGDKTEGVKSCAQEVLSAAKTAQASAPSGAQPLLTAVEGAARALAEGNAEDIADLRMRFGELSRAVVGLLEVAPDAAEGYHVFECPMTKTYKRWAQPTTELRNPYFGSSMIDCGDEVQLGADK
jgi:hypothetical protein